MYMYKNKGTKTFAVNLRLVRNCKDSLEPEQETIMSPI